MSQDLNASRDLGLAVGGLREPVDRYARLRTIPDYLEGRTIGSAYVKSSHPYSGQLQAANRDYAADLRALLSERDRLFAERQLQGPGTPPQPSKEQS